MATGTGVCQTPYIPNGGPRAWSMRRLRNGGREYRITQRVEVDPDNHGPLAALSCPGLLEVGTVWNEGDFTDQWAYVTAEAEVVQVGKEHHNKFFDVTQIATTEPTQDCQREGLDNPLAFPDRVRVETVTYSKEGTHDRDGFPLLNSAFEQYRGPQVEYDAHRVRVVIEQNAAALELDLVESMMHTLNDAELWGFDPRLVKLSLFEGEPKFHTNCQKYWLRRFVFDIARDFDKCLLDEGTKVLRGQWDRNPASPTYGQYVIPPDPSDILGILPLDHLDPKNYIRYVDWHGNNGRVILNGRGKPYDPVGNTTGTDDDVTGQNCFEYYDESNLLLLGIPLDLG